MSPTQRSLAKLRADGYLCAVVERWNPHARIRQDLWNCLDVLAVRGSETLGIQVTSGSNVSSRVRKLAASDAVPVLRRAGWRLLVHGWRKGSNGRYALREVDCTREGILNPLQTLSTKKDSLCI